MFPTSEEYMEIEETSKNVYRESKLICDINIIRKKHKNVSKELESLKFKRD